MTSISLVKKRRDYLHFLRLAISCASQCKFLPTIQSLSSHTSTSIHKHSVKELLTELLPCYRFEEAIPLLAEVIKAAPNLKDPYKTLGQCYEQTGDRRKALDFYMITAHMAPKVPKIFRSQLPALFSPRHLML